MGTPASIATRLKRIITMIGVAEARYGRQPGSVKLLVVSKAKPVEAITAAAAAGQKAFGENYVQEAQKKIETIGNCGIEWHFVGPIQSNKTRHIAGGFAWVHSVDRISIAKRLSQQRPAEAAPLNVCVQLNISGEKTKSGVAVADVEEILKGCASLPGINLRGLMAIPAPVVGFDAQRRVFSEVKRVFDTYFGPYNLDTLSMGMSGDFEAAIAEGATLVRLGTAVLGSRES